ncbi:uncharacterized protein PG998_013664 [Apiospora kogelbergensis]|uniref:uncharacterized protein n=1 Tax=Apiospora kogelbergensis TaxID=1337665 RepID=UPI003131C18A
MHIPGSLLLTAVATATALPAPEDQPGKKPGWSYEIYYWNISNLRALEINSRKNAHFQYSNGDTLSLVISIRYLRPCLRPPSVYAAPSIPSFTGTCEGATTAQTPDQSAYMTCTTSRKTGETSDGGTFGGLSARVKPNPNDTKPGIAISFQWTQEMR